MRDLRSHVVGSTVAVQRREGDWAIEFANRFVLGVGAMWRLIGVTYVCVTSEDDGHQFGLPSPVDAEAKANELLAGKTVEAAECDFATGDLRFRFEGPLTLEIVTTSSGYESWQMWDGWETIAIGASGGLR